MTEPDPTALPPLARRVLARADWAARVGGVSLGRRVARRHGAQRLEAATRLSRPRVHPAARGAVGAPGAPAPAPAPQLARALPLGMSEAQARFLFGGRVSQATMPVEAAIAAGLVGADG